MGCVNSKTEVKDISEEKPKLQDSGSGGTTEKQPPTTGATSPGEKPMPEIVPIQIPLQEEKPPQTPKEAFEAEQAPKESPKKKTPKSAKSIDAAPASSPPTGAPASAASATATTTTTRPDQDQVPQQPKQQGSTELLSPKESKEPKSPGDMKSPKKQLQPLSPGGRKPTKEAGDQPGSKTPDSKRGKKDPAERKKAVLVEVDMEDFKPRSRKGNRAPAPELLQRLEGGESTEAKPGETAEELKARLEKAEQRRQAEREKRRQRAAKEVAHVDERREQLKAMEEHKADELKRMISSKTKVADNNRESAMDVVRIKKGGHHSHVKKAREKPKVSVLGDLPPIGKGCLLAPEGTVPTSTTDESTPKTSPHTPATLAGMVTPEVQSPKGKSETFQTRVDAPLGKEVAIEQPKSEEPKLVEPVAAAEAPGPV